MLYSLSEMLYEYCLSYVILLKLYVIQLKLYVCSLSYTLYS